MVSVLASSAVDCGFEPRSGQIKDYEIGICCFSAKHAVLRSKIKDDSPWYVLGFDTYRYNRFVADWLFKI